MNDLEEELTGSRVEDEDGSVDGLGGQVSFERLVDRDSVDVGVVDWRRRRERSAQATEGGKRERVDSPNQMIWLEKSSE